MVLTSLARGDDNQKYDYQLSMESGSTCTCVQIGTVAWHTLQPVSGAKGSMMMRATGRLLLNRSDCSAASSFVEIPAPLFPALQDADFEAGEVTMHFEGAKLEETLGFVLLRVMNEQWPVRQAVSDVLPHCAEHSVARGGSVWHPLPRHFVAYRGHARGNAANRAALLEVARPHFWTNVRLHDAIVGDSAHHVMAPARRSGLLVQRDKWTLPSADATVSFSDHILNDMGRGKTYYFRVREIISIDAPLPLDLYDTLFRMFATSPTVRMLRIHTPGRYVARTEHAEVCRWEVRLGDPPFTLDFREQALRQLQNAGSRVLKRILIGHPDNGIALAEGSDNIIVSYEPGFEPRDPGSVRVSLGVTVVVAARRDLYPLLDGGGEGEINMAGFLFA